MALIAPRAIKKPVRRPRVYYPVSDGEPMGETDLHRMETTYLIDALDIYFADRPDVYVSGDNFIYYQEGNPRKCVSPDAYVVFGVPKKLRDCYFTWKERGRLPHVVIEVTSAKTRREDLETKFDLYEQVLRVPEYYLFDPTADYIKEQLRGYKLQGTAYLNIPLTDNRLHSDLLGLDLVLESGRIRLYDQATEERLLTAAELAGWARESQAEVARLKAELEQTRRGTK